MYINPTKVKGFKRGLGLNLIMWGTASFSGGISQIVNSCGSSNKAACAVGAIQTVIGGLASLGGLYAGFQFGYWKRDEDGIVHLYESKEKIKTDMTSLHVMASHEVVHVNVHKLDGTVYDLLYKYRNETASHLGWTSFNSDVPKLDKREQIGINDGYGGELVQYVKSAGALEDFSSGSVDNYVADWTVYELAANGDADSACIGFVESGSIHGQNYADQYAGLRIQVANQNNFGGINNICRNDYYRVPT